MPNSKAFGYSLSGGLDIDSNGYADVSIGDLSGNHVTTFRSSPLVTVMMEFQDLRSLLDIAGDADRRCPLAQGGRVNLLCFDVTPCFYYESNEVNEFGEKNSCNNYHKIFLTMLTIIVCSCLIYGDDRWRKEAFWTLQATRAK